MLLGLHLLQQFYLASPPKPLLYVLTPLTRTKSTVYFFIKRLYEEIFKDGQTQEADEIIYTDEPSSEFKIRIE